MQRAKIPAFTLDPPTAEEAMVPQKPKKPETGTLFPDDEPKKKKKRALQRSMERLRADGFCVGKTEHWNPFVPPNGRLQDLFGFCDLIYLDAVNFRIVAVQVTKGDVPRHIEKIQANDAAKTWLACNGRIVVHHWRELGPKDFKKWVMECIEVTA